MANHDPLLIDNRTGKSTLKVWIIFCLGILPVDHNVILRDMEENRSLGDVTTLADPTVMNLIGLGLKEGTTE